MRAKSPAGAVILLLGALAGCGKDDVVGPKPAEITGNWTATKVEYVSKAAPGARVDLIAAGGWATLQLNQNQSMVYVECPSGGSPDSMTGTWRLDGDLFHCQRTGMSWAYTWDVSLSGTTLSLVGADAEYDCDCDGSREQADWNMMLTR